MGEMKPALIFWRGTEVYIMAKVDSPTLRGKPPFCHCPCSRLIRELTNSLRAEVRRVPPNALWQAGYTQ